MKRERMKIFEPSAHGMLYLCWTDVHMKTNLLERQEIDRERGKMSEREKNVEENEKEKNKHLR